MYTKTILALILILATENHSFADKKRSKKPKTPILGKITYQVYPVTGRINVDFYNQSDETVKCKGTMIPKFENTNDSPSKSFEVEVAPSKQNNGEEKPTNTFAVFSDRLKVMAVYITGLKCSNTRKDEYAIKEIKDKRDSLSAEVLPSSASH